MHSVKEVVRKFIPRPIQTPPSPVEADETAYSAISSIFDDEARPSQRLIELTLDAVERAMKDVQARGSVWPGEELCLIGGLVLAMRAKVVVEVGEANQKVSEIVKRYLEGGRYQHVERIGDEIADADLILVNGRGDGELEKGVLEDLGRIKFARPPIVVLNDTRRWDMLKLVREIAYPKLDMTSFGRWTGTMLVELI